IAAAPLPAARQITRPFGTGRKCAARTTSGCAAATAASKIVRRRGRRSVIVVPLAAPLAVPLTVPLASLPPAIQVMSVADQLAADDIAEQLPAFALELHQLQLLDRLKIVRARGERDAGQQPALRELLEAGRLFHDVAAGQVVAAPLQDFDHGRGHGVAGHRPAVGSAAPAENSRVGGAWVRLALCGSPTG